MKTVFVALASAFVLPFVSANGLSSEWTTPLKEGDTVPSVTFKTRVRIESDEENPFDWKDLTSEDYFKGKRTVIFALPGAFTPTCSASHLPGYDALYEDIKALGVDEVYCLSVNDAFVMRQWGLHQGYVPPHLLERHQQRRCLTFWSGTQIARGHDTWFARFRDREVDPRRCRRIHAWNGHVVLVGH